MKKIILSVAVATMALSTAASALEDIKTSGKATVWYETNNAGNNTFGGENGSMGDYSIRLDITGKQGNIGFGTTVYSATTMGLENTGMIGNGRVNITPNTDDTEEVFFTQAYITAPLGSNTLLKMGKQELNTPLVFSEKWTAVTNSYDAALVINNSIANTTLIAAYVGQNNGAAHGNINPSEFNSLAGAGASAIAALYKNDAFNVNAWYYDVNTVATAYWVDAGATVAGVDLKAIYVNMDPEAAGDETTAYAVNVGAKVSGISLSAAISKVSDTGTMHVANLGTAGKKSKLGTDGVYTDGQYVARNGSTAVKIKAAGSVAGYKLALQHINNANDAAALDATETDLIAAKKFGDFNMKAILMHRTGSDTTSQQHLRVVAGIDF